MLKYIRKHGLRFHAPDNGQPSSGGNPNPAGNGTANPPQQQQNGQTTPPDPFAGIDTSGMDDVALAKFNEAKASFASLQNRASQAEQQARQHQSERDRATARLNQIQQSVTGQDHTQPTKPQTTEDRVYAQMVAGGIAPEVAKGQAGVMAKILDGERAQIQKSLGEQFAPVAQLTLAQTAEGAFNHARMADRVGWSVVPEVAQLVWQSCTEIAGSGQPVTPETVQNLARMHFMAHAESNPAVFASLQNLGQPVPPNNGQVNPQQPPTVPMMPMMPFNGGNFYPGANFMGRQVQQPPNNGIRAADPATLHAINSVNNVWAGMGLKPKGT